MFRPIITRLIRPSRILFNGKAVFPPATTIRTESTTSTEVVKSNLIEEYKPYPMLAVLNLNEEELDNYFVWFFDRPDIDGWELRQAIYCMNQFDMIPEPKIMISVLYACRRLNDYAVAVRFLETVQMKCGKKLKKIWPYLLQEVKPTLDELGVLTPQEMGFDEPEFSSWDSDRMFYTYK